MQNSALPGELGFAVLDLETTGKDPVEDRITEFAMICVDPELRELFRVTSPVATDEYGLARIASAPVVDTMTRDSGLLADLTSGVTWPDVVTLDSYVTQLLARAAFGRGEGAWVIAGSGVGAHDVPFIRRHMPGLAESAVYYPHDIGIMRREYRRVAGSDLVEANKNKTHRAMDDAECHLEEIRAFRRAFRAAFGDESAGVAA